MKKTLEERFWEKIEIGGPDDCWPWLAKTNGDGYGVIRVMGRMEKAHRIAYMLAKGSIPTGMDVCHSCDNPPCQNPKHLWPGTNTDNVRDRNAKRRTARGEQHGRAKLTKAGVSEIKRLGKEGLSQGKIAAIRGVSRQQIGKILNGKQWRGD